MRVAIINFYIKNIKNSFKYELKIISSIFLKLIRYNHPNLSNS